jgi:hypothetical protein
MIIAATAPAEAQTYTPFGSRYDGSPSPRPRASQPATEAAQEAGMAEMESPLRKEWNALCAQRVAMLMRELAAQNAADERKLTELKNKTADIALARHCFEQIAAVRRGDSIDADEPESATPARPSNSLALSSGRNLNSPEAQLWRIKVARDEAINRAAKRVADATRAAALNLQQRAVKANDFDLAEDIKEMLGSQIQRTVQEPWLGTFVSGNETMVISRLGRGISMTVDRQKKSIQWYPETRTIKVDVGSFWEWHVRVAGSSRLIETKSRNPGKVWTRKDSAATEVVSATAMLAAPVGASSFIGTWTASGTDHIRIWRENGETKLVWLQDPWRRTYAMERDAGNKIVFAQGIDFLMLGDGTMLERRNGKRARTYRRQKD